MPVLQHSVSFRRLSADALAPWAEAGAAAISDCLERAGAMAAGIAPLSPGMRVVGQARTVRCMAADNSALHAALEVVEPGDVLVADAGGFLGNAVWGGLMTEAARRRGVAGLVVDGAVRDASEIIAAAFPCFARGCVPAGPHKLFGGALDAPVGCGGVPVHPGDLVIGDADGVVVVPLARVEAVAEALAALQEKERKALAALDDGRSLAAIYGVPEIDRV